MIYDTCMYLNRRLICGESVSSAEKSAFADGVLRAVCSTEEANRFYTGVRYPGNCDNRGNRMYPFFLIPPYNGGNKLPTVTGLLPKTHILSANSYEIEMLSMARRFAAETSHPFLPELNRMHEATLLRLKTTCYGTMDDGIGECFDASLLVLRYLAQEEPRHRTWIRSRIANYRRHVHEIRRHPAVQWYFRLCLTELPAEQVRDEIALELPFITPTGNPLYNAIGQHLTAMR